MQVALASPSFLIKTRGVFIWKPDPGLDLVGNLADEFKSSRGGFYLVAHDLPASGSGAGWSARQGWS